MEAIYGGIEAGGTKFVCAIGSGPDRILAEAQFPTTTPAETLDRTAAFFHSQAALGPLEAVGLGTFGPLDLAPGSPTYGSITSTPKPGWAYTPLVAALSEALGTPVAFDTDVNAAAMGEYRWGAGRGLESFIYLTVGTGIGGGALAGGRLVHGLLHPEMGHTLIPHRFDEDPFAGVCPYHGDCFEGLASGPAMHKRWGTPAENLPPEHPAWELEAVYLGLALSNFILTLSPQRIILGGGVMQQTHLLPMVRRKVQESLNGYVDSPQLAVRIDEYIVTPGLGKKSGVLGALALAMSRPGESGMTAGQ